MKKRKESKAKRVAYSYRSPQQREIRKWEGRMEKAIKEGKYFEYRDAKRHLAKLRRNLER